MASISAVVDNVTPAETIKDGFDTVNEHYHDYDGVELTNSAAGTTTVGDVLAWSSMTAILGDTVSSLQKYVVAQAATANAAVGEFARSGYCTAKSTGTIAAMQFVRKSATARAIEDAGVAVSATNVPPMDAIGFATAAASGNLCAIFLYDRVVDFPDRKGTDSASAAALALADDGNYFDVTGTTTITSIESRPAGFELTLQFDGALTLTHNATTLILSGATNVTTAAGRVFTFVSEGSGNWRETSRSGTDPLTLTTAAASPPAVNTLYKDNIPKAWANVTVTPTLADGFNIASVADSGVGSTTVTIDTDFANTTYAPIATTTSSGSKIISTGSLVAGALEVKTFDNAGGAEDVAFAIVIFGDQ